MGFPPNIYFATMWGPQVGAGVSGTVEVELRGYAKLNSTTFPYCVANEYVANRLGQLLGLPVPPGAPIKDPGGNLAWVTLAFSAKKADLPPVDPTVVVTAHPALSAAVTVFDLLIANMDRHTGNLSYRPSSKRLDVFDHSHSLFGIQPDGPAHLTAVRDEFVIQGGHGNRQCLLSYLTNHQHVLAAVEATMHRVDDPTIESICDGLTQLEIVSPAEADSLRIFLRSRRDNLRRLVNDHRSEFTGITDGSWGLGI